jgi:hypothetical protein
MYEMESETEAAQVSTHGPRFLFFGLLLWNIVQVGLTVEQWPLRVAIQFNAQGQARGWASREAHLWMWLGLSVLLPAFMVGIFASIRYFPPQMINIPNRHYWLAPERRETSLRMVSRMGYGFACMLLLFLAGLYWILLLANQAAPPQLSAPAMWLALGLYLTAVAGWLIALYRRFRLPN